MTRPLRYILIISVLLTGLGVFVPIFGAQAAGGIDVEFETGSNPLFEEANFLPGDTVSRWVKVTNNSGEPQTIAVRAEYALDPDKLGEAIDFSITEGTETPFSGTLASFFLEIDGVALSTVENGATAEYTFSASFNPDTDNNELQGKSLSFDISVGTLTEEEGDDTYHFIAISGGGGGGPQGLIIYNEEAEGLGSDVVTITWHTNRNSTSRVIYSAASEPHELDITDTSNDPPLYGYAHTTAEYDTPALTNGVTFHTITIAGLTPGTEYFYRCISHSSPDTISREHGFATLASEEMPEQTEKEEEGQEREEGETGGTERTEGAAGESSAAQGSESAVTEEETAAEGSGEEESLPAEEILDQSAGEETEKPSFLASLLAGLGNLLFPDGLCLSCGNSCLLYVLICLGLIVLYLLLRSRLWRTKEDGQKKRRHWDSLALSVLLIIFAFVLECYLLIIPALILILDGLRPFFKKQNGK